MEIATTHDLHEFVFRIEHLLNGLRECVSLDDLETTIPEPGDPTEELREVSASLAAFAD